jgi:SAM-dependent methyltransferase
MPHRFGVTQLAFEKLQELNGSEFASHNDDGSGYESPDYANLRKIIAFVDPKPHDVVFDLGSGMGRVLCLFARRKLKGCVGIELYPSLCEVAERNAQTLRGRVSLIEVRQGDVAQADFTDGTIFFLFNPFGAETLRAALKQINASRRKAPREIKLIYYKDLHANVLEDCSWLEKFNEMKTFSGIRVSFWRSRTIAGEDADEH